MSYNSHNIENLGMLLLAASHIKFIQCIQLRLHNSSFLNAKIIQKHANTYYSSTY